jgi:competence protein ComGC
MNASPPLPSASQPPQNSPLAIWSLVLGILALACFSVLTAVPAVICGHKARTQIKRSGGALTGEGLALGGLITGYVSIALTVLLIPLLAAVAIPNFARARDQAQRNACWMNLEQIESTKQVWALENKKSGTDVPSETDLKTYFKDSQIPACPKGGTYTLNAVDTRATCSLHGDGP